MFFTKKPKIKKIKEELNKNPNTNFTLAEIFPDSNLSNQIAQALGIDLKQKITLNQLQSIETLNCSGSNINSLEGIEFLNNLKTANFSNNNITKLPDYTENNSNIYKNRDTLILMDLSNNPFLNSANLFSLENSEQRRKFIGQFEDSYSRFKLNPVKDQLFSEIQINPELIRIAIDSLLPRKSSVIRSNEINDIFLKYLIGKKIFYNKTPYKNDYLLNQGKISFKTNLIEPKYLSDENKKIVAQLIEEILPQEDLYLIRSIISEAKPILKINSNNIEDYINYYQEHPNEISVDYIQDSTGWKEKSKYTDLRNANHSSQEEMILKSIENSIIKDEYDKYLQMKDILELYQNDHPEKTEEISKLIKKNDDQISNFLKQYSKLEQNEFLTKKQKETIAQAEQSIQTFNNSYLKQATDLFEQDVFGLEVEMKYIDMLAQANNKITSE